MRLKIAGGVHHGQGRGKLVVARVRLAETNSGDEQEILYVGDVMAIPTTEVQASEAFRPAVVALRPNHRRYELNVVDRSDYKIKH